MPAIPPGIRSKNSGAYEVTCFQCSQYSQRGEDIFIYDSDKLYHGLDGETPNRGMQSQATYTATYEMPANSGTYDLACVSSCHKEKEKCSHPIQGGADIHHINSFRHMQKSKDPIVMYSACLGWGTDTYAYAPNRGPPNNDHDGGHTGNIIKFQMPHIQRHISPLAEQASTYLIFISSPHGSKPAKTEQVLSH